MGKLSPEQKKVLDAINRGAKRNKASPKEHKAAVETGLVEANLTNPKDGDADSGGWRQERRRYYKDPTNIDASVDRFFKETRAVKHKYGRAGDLAAAVQRPAAQYRGRYQERSAEADKLIGKSTTKTTQNRRVSGKTSTTKTTKQDVDAALLDSLMSRKRGKGSLLKSTAARLDTGAYDKTVTTKTPAPKREEHDADQLDVESPKGDGKLGKVNFAPGADRAGAPTKAVVKEFLAAVSRGAGNITVGTGTQHNKMSASGNVSDHWTGNGADVPATGKRGDDIAYAAFRAAGVEPKTARRYASNGGLYNIQHKGKRVQIIWKTNTGGNHYDHVHIGIR